MYHIYIYIYTYMCVCHYYSFFFPLMVTILLCTKFDMMLTCDKLWTHPASNRVGCEQVFWTQLENHLVMVFFFSFSFSFSFNVSRSNYKIASSIHQLENSWFTLYQQCKVTILYSFCKYVYNIIHICYTYNVRFALIILYKIIINRSNYCK